MPMIPTTLDSKMPTPRDFSEFVFCGMKWVLDKKASNIKDKMLSARSYESSEQSIALKMGQNNEAKCIKWVLCSLGLSEQDILFDGTGESNQYLSSSTELGNPLMKCKPDLIISYGDNNILYEFKAVKSDKYLNMLEFKSNHAQIWCYSKISDISINKYYLFRYYIDPFDKLLPYNKSAYKLKEIIFSNDEELYFRACFTKYLEFIKMYNANDSSLISMMMEFYTPITEGDKAKKCSNCYYKNKNICNKEEWELQKGLK